MGGLKWTHKTTDKISAELAKAGLLVGPRTVARLLAQMNYALRVNHKKRATIHNEHRDRQFQYIKATRAAFQDRRAPVVSVDSKKKEMVGNFKNPGAVWAKEATAVNDHDFMRDATGIALPRGTYDTTANRGHVCVGISHDTPEFAVDALVQWWKDQGRRRYPRADQLLILADGGGSNASRSRVWKHRLQTKFCSPFGIRVTVCHYPPGTSKWNPIEHRLFSEISKNWKGRPLDNYETIFNYIETTRTKTGLTTTAKLLKGTYPIGVRVSKQEMATIKLRRHEAFPDWNYTISPN